MEILKGFGLGVFNSLWCNSQYDQLEKKCELKISVLIFDVAYRF